MLVKGDPTWQGPPVAGDGEPPDNVQMEHRITALETRLDTLLPTLATKADLAHGFADMVKWIIGTGFAGLAAFVTIMTFVLNNATPKAPAAPQPAPIVITIPVPAASK